MWNKFDIVFTLKSPLHIGYLPFKGTVISPTRYYIPGKNFWGAITKRATEYLCNNPLCNNPSKEYKDIGRQFKDNFRFSYFYLYDDKTVFIPKYDEGGLNFGGKLDKFQFEHRFIGSRVSTAIDSNTRTAKDGNLHEIEFINNKFIDEKGNIRNTKIIGCIWIKEDAKWNGFNIELNNNRIILSNNQNKYDLIDELTLGGEQGYGFGLVKLESISKNGKFPINSEENSNGEIKITNTEPILSHLKYDKNINFKGEIEPLSGRGYFDIEKENQQEGLSYKKNPGKVLASLNYYFSPGTYIFNSEKELLLEWNGVLHWQ